MAEERRYVVLRHDHPSLHWDLMLDEGASLKTWRVPEPIRDGLETGIEPLPDHRRDYLRYEGEVSGGRGVVSRVEEGNYSVVDDNESKTTLVLSGTLNGTVVLDREGDTWRLAFRANSSSE